MFFKLSALTALVAACRFVAASPSPQITTQFGTFLTVCTDPEFEGTCTSDFFVEHDECTQFPAQFQDNVSSLSIPEHWICDLFVSHDCNSASGTVALPAGSYSDLAGGDNAYNTVICSLDNA